MNQTEYTHKPFSFWAGWLLRLFALIVLGAVVISAIFWVVSQAAGMDINDFSGVNAHDGSEQAMPWMLRFSLAMQHIFTFVMPAGIVMYLFKKMTGNPIAGFNTLVNPVAVWIGVFFLMASYPLVQFFAELNQMFHLPDLLKDMEEQSQKVIKLLLADRSIVAFLANLLIMAIIPAIGEELVFRGVLQTALHGIFKHKIAAVWLTAFLFSAMHFQFEGFLPRFVLGLVLGYLMLWSGNLIFPIIAHFFNNGLQIAIQHFVVKDINQIDALDNVKMPFITVVGAVVVMAFLSEYFKKLLQKSQETS